MSADFRLQVKFWGVRGSIATPEPANMGYGGNTACIEIRSRLGERLIVDGGTGIRTLGRRMLAESPAAKVNVFLTHFHWDHIQGLPSFAPLLTAGNTLRFHSFPPAAQIRERLERLMSSPFFTLDFNSVASAREFVQVEPGEFHCGDFRVVAFPLNHPQGASGYRIESAGAAVVIASDFEHGNAALDKVLRDNAAGADVLIYDAQYTDAEYAGKKGWGHSTAREAARAAADSQVKRLVLFHHDPTHDDAKMDEVVRETCELFEATSGAKESCLLTI